MKANFDGIEIEGTPEEIGLIIASIRSKSPAKERTIAAKPISQTTTFNTPTSALLEEGNDEKLDDFIKALFRYRSDKTSSNGRAPYIIRLLATGEQYNIKSLMRLSGGNQTLVANAIKRAADAGCIIEVSGNTKLLTRNTRVQLKQLGTVEQAAAVKLSMSPSKQVQNEITTSTWNSSPITKIGSEFNRS
jgi:hypothetical protein